jgi:hypothetical protein
MVAPERMVTVTGDVPDWSEDTWNFPGATENLYVTVPCPD